jgi:signal transduction histidine kinase
MNIMKLFQRCSCFNIAFVLAAMAMILLPGCCIIKNNSRAESNELAASKKIAIAVTHSSAAALGALLKDTKDENARIEIIRKFIDPIRFYEDNSGYFYVYNFDCVNIAHATQKDLPGKNLYNHQDTKGKYVIRELSAQAKKGGGFVEFHWVKPGDVGEHRKLGYVEPIPGTNYFIGTGVYIPES